MLWPMPARHDHERFYDRVILLFLLALFLLASPLRHWWATEETTWLAPYLIWGGIIALAYWLQRRMERHDH